VILLVNKFIQPILNCSSNNHRLQTARGSLSKKYYGTAMKLLNVCSCRVITKHFLAKYTSLKLFFQLTT